MKKDTSKTKEIKCQLTIEYCSLPSKLDTGQSKTVKYNINLPSDTRLSSEKDNSKTKITRDNINLSSDTSLQSKLNSNKIKMIKDGINFLSDTSLFSEIILLRLKRNEMISTYHRMLAY